VVGFGGSEAMEMARQVVKAGLGRKAVEKRRVDG